MTYRLPWMPGLSPELLALLSRPAPFAALRPPASLRPGLPPLPTNVGTPPPKTVLELRGPYVTHIPNNAPGYLTYISHGRGWIPVDTADLQQAWAYRQQQGLQPRAVVGTPGIRIP